MKEETQLIAGAAASNAIYGGMAAATISVASGAAIITTPVKILGLITIGTTTTISLPIVIGAGLVGAAVVGAGAACYKKREINLVNRHFESGFAFPEPPQYP